MHRYKALLQKQRDIMIALTARLNERDEALLSMQATLPLPLTLTLTLNPSPNPNLNRNPNPDPNQEEHDRKDGRTRELEDALDRKTAQLIHLQVTLAPTPTPNLNPNPNPNLARLTLTLTWLG